MEESQKSQYKYCLIVKKEQFLRGLVLSIHWKPYATNNNKKSSSISHDNKVDKYLLHVHEKILIYQLILYNG